MFVYFCSRHNDPNGLSVLLVYVLSQRQLIRLFLLYHSYKKMVNVDPIYCYYSFDCIFLFLTFIPTFCDSCLYIFVLDNNLPDKICCYLITVECLILIKLIVLSGRPVYFYSRQLSKHSITCNCTLLMSPNISVLSHTFTVLKYF
jgi:hypothetical protein